MDCKSMLLFKTASSLLFVSAWVSSICCLSPLHCRKALQVFPIHVPAGLIFNCVHDILLHINDNFCLHYSFALHDSMHLGQIQILQA
ncbi:hypothetical protein KC19_VG290900 [Ceratodon purpureus]|uniref:Secreted protein n=1 Tax=Ceratodon purpureus TaxID=3225 RepID=A0A8T0HWE0_CERPU|nr:hypothetical protein KC19_VG290900 [Ceratodon purpureus]